MSGLEIQQDLLDCEIVQAEVVTSAGPGRISYLKLGSRVIEIGADHQFANFLAFALRRNADAFERMVEQERQEAATAPEPPGAITQPRD